MKTQEIAIAFIVVTIGLSFFAMLIMSGLKLPVDPAIQTAVIAMFTSAATGVLTWVFTKREGEAREDAAFSQGLVEGANAANAAAQNEQG